MSKRERRLRKILKWIVETVLLHGGSEFTAYVCAADFAKGVREEWAKQHKEQP